MNEPAIANNSDINEDLGQIEFLFSDKTGIITEYISKLNWLISTPLGTLTENQMIFKKFAIDGVIYEEESSLLFNSIDNDKKLSKSNVSFY